MCIDNSTKNSQALHFLFPADPLTIIHLCYNHTFGVNKRKGHIDRHKHSYFILNLEITFSHSYPNQ